MVTLPATVYSQQMVKKKLNVYYPVVHLTNQAVQHSMNSKILQRTNELIRQQGYEENPDTEETGYYELKTNERNVLSLTLVNFAYSGGAHGLTVVVPLTFNVLTGKTYQLKDLFKKDSNYVSILSKIVGEQIKERDIMVLGEYKGIKPDQDFYIADKSLVLFYQLYDLAPYAYGIPYFPISIYAIQDIIEDESPLGQMFG
ncbi:DUF3298 domain-containing protein [Priestia megaterium]|uniref:DUF3298 and DUF4163 domain-containing protein n=1 Tax=Priestia megaterium TaxID=1404 RepID=UPI000BFD228A|nr:DUF3298 and DUF4163 domain-containing protein [Priestia megaterium]MEB2292624.1 DUF3298 and DUF4163 domain-containing protein [Priestia megaterium]PGK30057.1 hypothetical protein CN902_12725 [Priestia megaterium]